MEHVGRPKVRIKRMKHWVTRKDTHSQYPSVQNVVDGSTTCNPNPNWSSRAIHHQTVSGRRIPGRCDSWAMMRVEEVELKDIPSLQVWNGAILRIAPCHFSQSLSYCLPSEWGRLWGCGRDGEVESRAMVEVTKLAKLREMHHLLMRSLHHRDFLCPYSASLCAPE